MRKSSWAGRRERQAVVERTDLLDLHLDRVRGHVLARRVRVGVVEDETTKREPAKPSRARGRVELLVDDDNWRAGTRDARHLGKGERGIAERRYPADVQHAIE